MSLRNDNLEVTMDYSSPEANIFAGIDLLLVSNSDIPETTKPNGPIELPFIPG